MRSMLNHGVRIEKLLSPRKKFSINEKCRRKA